MPFPFGVVADVKELFECACAHTARDIVQKALLDRGDLGDAENLEQCWR
jgi:hypothetical protein